uniref:Uncharacterized protein n=1 Tax=Sphaerodactylus townsendi TaxID=933632 RepID=A0ACB8F5I0_9SAUR
MTEHKKLANASNTPTVSQSNIVTKIDNKIYNTINNIILLKNHARPKMPGPSGDCQSYDMMVLKVIRPEGGEYGSPLDTPPPTHTLLRPSGSKRRDLDLYPLPFFS